MHTDSHRADEIPLVTAKRSCSRSEIDGLLRVVHLDAQRAFMRTYHVRGNMCGGGFFAGIAVGPSMRNAEHIPGTMHPWRMESVKVEL